MMRVIRTILGDISPEELGAFNYHEHAFQRTPLLLNEDLDDYEKSLQEFTDLKNSGFNGYLESTPIGLGRNPELVAQLAKDTNLKIVHTTGFHKLAHYSNQPELMELDLNQKIDLIISEINQGFHSSTHKAGVVKVGIGESELSEFEKTSLKAAAYANLEIDVAIMVHLDKKSDAHVVLDFFESQGVNLARVLLAHADSKTEIKELKSLLKRGAYLGLDRAARLNEIQEIENLKLFAELVNAGFSKQLLFGGDLARRSRYLSYGGRPGLKFLGEKFIPKMIAVTSESVLEQMLKKNPINWLAFTPREIHV